MQRNFWSILLVVAVLAVVGCGNEEAERQAAEEAAAAVAAEQAAQEAAERAAAEQAAAEQAAREAAEREAAERAAAEAAARNHTVQPGDCLWCIAMDRWSDGYRWSDIYEANKEMIDNPDLIYPGQVFTMPSG